jgi:hypothetical protein
MGVEPSECFKVGSLLGEKTVLNEFVAYAHLAKDLSEGVQLSHRSVIICTYALCGFANFSSIAIQLGGIGVMAPNRRADLARLGLRAMIGGTLATCMTAARRRRPRVEHGSFGLIAVYVLESRLELPRGVAQVPLRVPGPGGAVVRNAAAPFAAILRAHSRSNQIPHALRTVQVN